MRREDRFSIVVSSSRRPRRVRGVGYVIDSSSLRAVPLFVPGGRSFVPACARRRAARKGRQGRPSFAPVHPATVLIRVFLSLNVLSNAEAISSAKFIVPSKVPPSPFELFGSPPFGKDLPFLGNDI